MKSKKESLQKLADADVRVQELMKQEQITLEGIRVQFPKEERTAVLRLLFETYNGLKGAQQDAFYQKISEMMPVEDKNRRWEYNHHQITWAISTLLQECGRMPTMHEIAHKAELSRQTVHKHLKHYAKDERNLEIVEQFRFMSSKVLARVFKYAVNGDMRAAKLYFDVVGGLDKQPAVPASITNTQNNYIQVNQIRLSQQSIEQLPADQLSQLEALLKTVMKNQEPT